MTLRVVRRGGDRTRVIGSNERQDVVAGVEYQRCFLARAAGIQAWAANQALAFGYWDNGAPDAAPMSAS